MVCTEKKQQRGHVTASVAPLQLFDDRYRSTNVI